MEEEPMHIVQVHSHLKVNGKHAFTVQCTMVDTGATIKHRITAAQGPPPRGASLQLYISGSEMADTASFRSLGHEFPPLLTVHGYHREVKLRLHGVAQSLAFDWSVHSTTTDVVKWIHHKLCPRDMRRMRVMHNGAPLPIENTYVYPPGAALPWDATMHDLGLAPSPDAPCSKKFYRSRNGVPIITTVNLMGTSTPRTAQQMVLDASERFIAHAMENLKMDDDGNSLHEPFDDDDEYLSPGGVKSVYTYSHDGEVMLSFMPPKPTAAQWTPRFVSIHEDYTVRHLSDFGVVPGSTLDVEFFNPHTQQWSGDVVEALVDEDASATDMISVRSHTGVLVRVPVSKNVKFSSVLERVWCATGELPMHTVLVTDAGKVVPEWATFVQASLYPQCTLYSVPRPQPWYGESVVVPKPTLQDTFSGVEEPVIRDNLVLN